MGKRIKEQIEWRRSKVAELDSQGCSQPEIANILHVSLGTVNGDLTHLRQQAKKNFRNHIEERLPHEYERCMIALNLIQKEAWDISRETKYIKEKLHALTLAKQCCEKKLDLLTNSTAIEDTMKLLSNHTNSVLPPPADDSAS